MNADEIARGLSPLDPLAASVKAARLLLHEIHEAIANRKTFTLESTLSGITYLRLLRSAKRKGYRIHLLYLWISSPRLAIRRVALRVRKGGHSVPEADIRRRYVRSLSNLVRFYAPIADSVVLLDNSGRSARLISDRRGQTTVVLNRRLFDIISAGKANETKSKT